MWLAQIDATGSSNSAWLLSDYQGSVTTVVAMSGGAYTQVTFDAYGNVTNTASYDASGNVTSASNALAAGNLSKIKGVRFIYPAQ